MYPALLESVCSLEHAAHSPHLLPSCPSPQCHIRSLLWAGFWGHLLPSSEAIFLEPPNWFFFSPLISLMQKPAPVLIRWHYISGVGKREAEFSKITAQEGFTGQTLGLLSNICYQQPLPLFFIFRSNVRLSLSYWVSWDLPWVLWGCPCCWPARSSLNKPRVFRNWLMSACLLLPALQTFINHKALKKYSDACRFKLYTIL